MSEESPMIAQIRNSEGVCGARVRKEAQRRADAGPVKTDTKKRNPDPAPRRTFERWENVDPAVVEIDDSED